MSWEWVLFLGLRQIIAAAQAARQRVLHEVDAAHASKRATLSDHERDARAHQGHLAAVATRATEAQRQPNLQVGFFAQSLLLPSIPYNISLLS